MNNIIKFAGEETSLDALFKIGMVLIVGILGGKLARLIKLPNVSGYLVAGLFLGNSFFKFIDRKSVV